MWSAGQLQSVIIGSDNNDGVITLMITLLQREQNKHTSCSSLCPRCGARMPPRVVCLILFYANVCFKSFSNPHQHFNHQKLSCCCSKLLNGSVHYFLQTFQLFKISFLFKLRLMMMAVRCGDWAGCGQQVCNLQLVLLPFNPTKNMRAILSSAHFLNLKSIYILW